VDTKPKLKDFENQVQAEFYREYDNFRLVDDILYRVKQDKNGFNRTQFVLPKQISQESITKIHSSTYGAHLGRKKTCNKVIERMYRPDLKNEVIEIVKTCDVCQKIKRNFS
jgi:acetoin utilization deacetylase AcuC-like enzyme